MTKEEFLAENPSVTKEQISKIEVPSSNNDNEALPKTFSCAYLTWSHDEGNMSTWKSSSYVTVRVDTYRNGEWKGAVFIDLVPGGLISFRQNLDGRNYDAFSC